MSDASADLDLAAIRERADAATPGPWASPECEANPGGWWILNGRAGTEEYAVGLTVPYNPRAEADARFIAAARADVDALLAEVERLQGELSSVWALADRRGEEIQLLRERILPFGDLDALGERISARLTERDAMRAVVEAAKAWAANVKAWGPPLRKVPGSIAGAEELLAAVDALPTPTEAGNG